MNTEPARNENHRPGRAEAPPPAGQPRAPHKARSRFRMRASLRWLLIAMAATLLVVATVFAQRQTAHPDMFRPVDEWDVGKADWWAYPLERNAFKRRVVRGDLQAVFALPNTQKLWAVGDGGLVLHSEDGGASWVQQRPTAAGVADNGRQGGAAAWSLFARAMAVEPPDPRQQSTAGFDGQQKAAVPVQLNASPGPAAPVITPESGPQYQPGLSQAAGKAAIAKPAAPLPKASKAAAPTRQRAVPPAGADPESADLYAVFFANERLGWAVGANGTVLTTSNGGGSWTVQASGSQADLKGVQLSADGQRGWAVGNDGTILATGNGGSSWAAQASGSQAGLNSLHLAGDGRRGWAVGADGTILATSNGGGSWLAQPSGSRSSLYGLYFAADGQRGWAVGDDGTVLVTGNGGSSWAAQASGSKARFYGVQFAEDARHGWLVGRLGTILATSNGGSSWTAQGSGSTARLYSLQVSGDGRHGWAVGRDGTILATSDGGGTWAAQSSGSRSRFYAVQFLGDGERGWIVGGDGIILATGNGGSSWAAQASGSTAWLYGVQFMGDGRYGWATGDGGTILASSNGGRSWTSQASGSTAWLSSVQFVGDGRRGWVVGSDGTILGSSDGGGSWAAQASGSSAWLYSVQFLGEGVRGWAVGDGGTILATGNGGSTWVEQASGSQATLYGVQFPGDGRRGWLVGSDGTILATGNDGTSWAAQNSGTSATLYGIQFLGDGQRGWVVGDGGSILASSGGVNGWLTQSSGSKSRLYGVQFAADGQRGWAVGGYGTILATRDGGRLWSEIAPYQRYWAPWYFAVLALLALGLFALLGLVEPVHSGSEADDGPALVDGAATVLRSDQPVADKLFDRLGVRPAVEALSSFIRNRNTEPRITIAITGEWGNGKSSVMRMLQTEVENAGFCTAWFNAWHHQQEGRQLSALFDAVRKQAVPRWWRQPVSALRVRSRLIWGRGGFYQSVAVATALLLALLAGDMLAAGWRGAFDRLRLNFEHHVLQQRQTAITGASLARLDPFARAVASQATPAAIATIEGEKAAPEPAKPRSASANPCDPPTWPALRKAYPVRPELFCYMQQHLQWEENGDDSHCGVQHDPPVDPARRCIFASAEDLLATVEAQGLAGARKLWPSERKAILAAAETLPPPPLFPWFENSLVGGLAGFLLLLFAKGITVYGVQLAAPLRALLATGTKDADGGKEATGTVERYRAEFSLLCDALAGRLVIFIDDLDRCTPETVSGMLEMTNYLVDVGRCFVVFGAAMDRVKRCVRSPVAEDDQADHDAYATAYLRKLVHIELPVPQHRVLLEGLAGAEATERPVESVRLQVRNFIWRSLLVAGAVAALLLVFFGGERLPHGGEGKVLQVQAVSSGPVAEPGQPTGSRQPPTSGTQGVGRQPGAATRPGDIGLLPTSPPAWPVGWFAATALLVFAGLLWHWLRRNRTKVAIALGGALRAEDSDRFMRALKIWNPVVVSYDPTPRHVKRFYNRARLFSAYEQQEVRQHAASDESLVALAAMHHLDPESLSVLANALAKAEQEGRGPVEFVRDRLAGPDLTFSSEAAATEALSDPLRAARAAVLRRAWSEHLAAFGSAPDASQVARFASRVEGILVR